ncbi:DUF3570 domain-containing protein [Salinibius halmophilus]|uniref:DUF3570 domain-containing protein n=1 Tax=Salinibius halmophilus TaxID=1853216 RepID=UPI000E66C9CC|nr:DUF3570 domain-containing protein [Salinibius halmophilus]
MKAYLSSAVLLAASAMVYGNSAPVTTNLGYQVGLTNQQAFDQALLNPSTSDYQTPAHDPQSIQQHLFTLGTGVNENLGVALNYRLGQYAGNGVHSIYKDVDVDTSGTNVGWTAQTQTDSNDKQQGVIRGVVGPSQAYSEHDVVLDTRLYSNNVVAGLSADYLVNPRQQTAGAALDIAFDGNNDQLVYSLGVRYGFTTLTSVFDANRAKAEQVVLSEADGEQVHRIAASQSLTIAFNKNIAWRFGAGIDASIGYLSNPYASFAIECGEGCHNDGSTETNESSFASSDVVDYRTELLPESRIGWHVHSNYRQFINPANAALHLDLRYVGNDWGVQQGMGRVAWDQQFDIATQRSTGILRWLERQDTAINLVPFARVAGQYKAAYYTQMTDPELTNAINASDNIEFAEGATESNFPSTIVTPDGTGLGFSQPNYYTSNPKYASYLNYSLGINTAISIADVQLSAGFESYTTLSELAGQVEVPGLTSFVMFTGGLDYKF